MCSYLLYVSLRGVHAECRLWCTAAAQAMAHRFIFFSSHFSKDEVRGRVEAHGDLAEG